MKLVLRSRSPARCESKAHHLVSALRNTVVAKEAGEEARIRRAYKILFGRDPLPKELAAGREFLRGKANAWPEYTQVLLASNEFLYVR